MNDSLDDAPARLDALEIRIAYQDEMIEDLNRMLVAQWRLVETISAEVRRLKDTLAALDDKVSTTPFVEPPPPHY